VQWAAHILLEIYSCVTVPNIIQIGRITYCKTKRVQFFETVYRVSQNKISQHENCYISELYEYFCSKFRSFVWHKTVHECVALCCIYLTYVKLMEPHPSRTNFTTELKVDFIYYHSNNWATSTTFVVSYYDVNIFMFMCSIINFQYFKS